MNKQDQIRTDAEKARKALSNLLSVSLDYLEVYLMPLADGKKGRTIANQFNDEVCGGIEKVKAALFELAAFGDKEVEQ